MGVHSFRRFAPSVAHTPCSLSLIRYADADQSNVLSCLIG
jgi:hypothetical protein